MTHESHDLHDRPPRRDQEEFCPYCMSRVAAGQSCPVCGLTQGAYTPAPHHLPLGTVLAGRYLVGRALGEGGFGITYIGCDLRLEMKVAIKEYFPVDRVSRYAETSLAVVSRVGTASQDYDQGLKRFLYEARTMARMEKQPQIVMVRDYFEANHTAYIVMEYVEGTNFMQLTAQRGGRIAASELLPLMEPLFSALSAVHAAGLIHRDISPDNLMLERGSVRLLDFGCARESARGTETMTIALKQGYAPIEQYQRKGQGPWTDVYALSATMYYCLTGKVPPQSLDRILEDELIPPRDLGVDLTEEQQAALLRGMELQPRRRYQTVEELHAGLYGSVPGAKAISPAPSSSLPEQTAESPEEPKEEPVPVPDGPSTAEPVLEPPATALARFRSWIRDHRRISIAIGSGAAALVLLLTAALSGVLFPAPPEEALVSSAGNSPVSGTENVSLENAPEPDRDALFAETVTVSTLEDFRSALTDGAVPAILCEGQLALQEIQDPSEQMEITKPVLVSEGCELISKGALVLRENGVLWMEGSLAGQGCLYTDGGMFVADKGSEIHYTLCLEQQTDLVDYGAEFLNEVHVLTAPDRYAEAVTVTNGQEFREAASRSYTKAIRVDGNVELLSDFSVSVPVLITENGSITVEAGNHASLSTTNSLLNYGTVSAGLHLAGDGAQLANYGRIEPAGGELWLGDLPDTGTKAAVNLGTIFIDRYSVIFCDFLNIGTITVEGEFSCLGLDQGNWYNYGRIEIAEGHVNAGSRLFYNNGVLLVGGDMELAGFLKNNGNLTVTSTGRLQNRGLMDCYDYDHFLTIEEGGSLDTEGGVLVTRTYSKPSGEITGDFLQVDFSAIDGLESVKATAASAQELLDALADPGVEAVLLEGDITLSEDLRLSKAVYVQNGSSLTLDNGATLTVSDAIFCVNGALTCDSLTLENGAMMELIGQWVCGEGTGSARITGNSWLYTRSSRLDFTSLSLEEGSTAIYDPGEGQELSSVLLSGGSTLVYASPEASAAQFSLTMDENSRMLQLCDFTVQAGTFQLNSGSYWQFGNLSLGQVQMTVEEESDLISFDALFTLGPEAVLDNRGAVRSDQFHELSTAWIQGTLRNSGMLLLSGTVLEGTLDNQGTIYSCYDYYPITLSGSGKVTGNTTVLLPEQWST